MDPTLSGVQSVAAKTMAPRFLGLRLRMAMSVRIDQGEILAIINCFMHERGP